MPSLSLKTEGSDAITGAKNFFVNPLGEEDKPNKFGLKERQASSCWFPTIDKPNER